MKSNGNKTKEDQLGMSLGKANGILTRDIMFSLLHDIKCFRCREDMTRETFSVDHKEPWLHSEDPAKNYFDMSNISFSHRKCNSAAARPVNKKYANKEEYKKGRGKLRKVWRNETKDARKVERRRHYLKTGN